MAVQDSQGFEVAHYDTQHLVSVRMWGQWDRELTRTFQHALGETLEELGQDGEEWWVLIDVTAFQLQFDTMEWMLCEQIETVSRRGIRKMAYYGMEPDIQPYVTRVLQKIALPRCACFGAYDDALQWLLKTS
jgi:hypothetical protein